jgi:hypothetical protein
MVCDVSEGRSNPRARMDVEEETVADPSIRERRLDQPGHEPGRMKPFRFGANVWRASSRAEWAEKARTLEDLGYATLTIPDHLTDLLAPMPALVSAAEATKRLRVGRMCSTTTSATPCWWRVRPRRGPPDRWPAPARLGGSKAVMSVWGS